MEQLHPVLPTQEQFKQWEDDWHNEREHADVLLIQAFQAGADTELEACCKWLDSRTTLMADMLHADRRPKPLSLKQQALQALTKIEDNEATYLHASIIRRALEALPD